MVEKLGSESHLIFSVDAPRVSTEAVHAAHDAEGHDEGVPLADDQRSEFTARIDGRHDVRPGETVELAVEHGALPAFDIETGLALRGGDAAAGSVAGGRLGEGKGSDRPGAPSSRRIRRLPP